METNGYCYQLVTKLSTCFLLRFLNLKKKTTFC